MTDEDKECPPPFDIELGDREKAILDCFELMERLVDEYGGRGSIVKVKEGKIRVTLEYDIPE